MKKRASFSQTTKDPDESLINLTPLIDVVFVVLIAFVLIAPLLEVEHVDLAPASPLAQKDISSKSRIAIYVRADNSIWLNHRLVSAQELTNLLRETKKRAPDQIPQVFHDSKANFGTYQTVKNSLEKAGFTQMDIILRPG